MYIHAAISIVTHYPVNTLIPWSRSGAVWKRCGTSFYSSQLSSCSDLQTFINWGFVCHPPLYFSIVGSQCPPLFCLFSSKIIWKKVPFHKMMHTQTSSIILSDKTIRYTDVSRCGLYLLVSVICTILHRLKSVTWTDFTKTWGQQYRSDHSELTESISDYNMFDMYKSQFYITACFAAWKVFVSISQCVAVLSLVTASEPDFPEIMWFTRNQVYTLFEFQLLEWVLLTLQHMIQECFAKYSSSIFVKPLNTTSPSV